MKLKMAMTKVIIVKDFGVILTGWTYIKCFM